MAVVRAPRTLDKAGRALWRSVTGKYELRIDELEVLKAACGETDLIAQLEVELGELPSLLSEGSMGQPVVHPLVPEIRAHRAAVASLLRGLKLPDEAGERSNQQREAAQSRWATPFAAEA